MGRLKVAGYVAIGLALLAAAASVGSCMHRDLAEADARAAVWSAKRQAQDQAAWDACLSKGGVPIRSGWDARMVRCDFPPAAAR